MNIKRFKELTVKNEKVQAWFICIIILLVYISSIFLGYKHGLNEGYKNGQSETMIEVNKQTLTLRKTLKAYNQNRINACENAKKYNKWDDCIDILKMGQDQE